MSRCLPKHRRPGARRQPQLRPPINSQTLTLADPVDGDVDAARLDEVRADIKSAGDIMRMMKSYSDDLMAEHKTVSPIFDKLHTLFNAGIAPQTMNGFYRGALISWQSQGLLAPFQREHDRRRLAGVRVSSRRGRERNSIQIDEAELAKWTEGGEPMGSDPAFNCSNTVAFRTLKEKFTRDVSKLAGVRMEDATPEEQQQVRLRRAHILFHWPAEQDQHAAGKQRQEGLPVQLSLETSEKYSARLFLHRRNHADCRGSLSGPTDLRDGLAEALGPADTDRRIQVQVVRLLSFDGRRVASKTSADRV